MAIEKLSETVYIDRDAKVIYFSSLDEESKFLIEMNKGEGFTVKSASEMPQPRKSSIPKKKAFVKTLTEEEKELFDKIEPDKKYWGAYYAVMAMRKQVKEKAAKPTKEPTETTTKTPTKTTAKASNTKAE